MSARPHPRVLLPNPNLPRLGRHAKHTPVNAALKSGPRPYAYQIVKSVNPAREAVQPCITYLLTIRRSLRSLPRAPQNPAANQSPHLTHVLAIEALELILCGCENLLCTLPLSNCGNFSNRPLASATSSEPKRSHGTVGLFEPAHLHHLEPLPALNGALNSCQIFLSVACLSAVRVKLHRSSPIYTVLH